MEFALLAVADAVYAIDRPYTYRVPQELRGVIVPGIRVVVPFGRGNRKSEALVLSLCEECEVERPKNILSALDDEPVLDEGQIRLALWMRDRFYCTVYAAVRAMLPTGLWFSVAGETPKRRVGDKMARYVRLSGSGEEACAAAAAKARTAPMQQAVLQLMSVLECVEVGELRRFTGASAQTIKALCRTGMLEEELREQPRAVCLQTVEKQELCLTPAQQEAVVGLTDLLDTPPACALLQGVTGSGKTAVYIALLEQAIQRGKTGIVMAPEIALTPQLMSLFAAHFGERVAVLHSGLSLGQRLDEWKRVRDGQVDVVVGTRSAVFAPLRRLAVIVMDEEQEPTYKSDNVPRYHAREVAKYRCARAGALLLLGSATPALESMHAAREGRYRHFVLPGRIHDRAMPEVHVVDMRQELRRGNTTTISRPLYEELARNLQRGEQSILFLNRRGYHRVLVCDNCGLTPECPHCTVKLTYHSIGERLLCHMCGYARRAPEICPSCGGKIRYFGAGTQKTAEELQQMFPGTQVARLDADTVGRQGAHEQIFSRFRQENIPFLVGTQMVAKGLDFPGVTLVGVLAAETSLFSDDYRANERTFSLLCQVIGRAGRGEKPGRAVVQTFTPRHPVIEAACTQDYDAFYADEIELRRVQHMPPLGQILTFCLFGLDEQAVRRACARLKNALDKALRNEYQSLALQTFGPAPASVRKVSNRYRYHITLTGEFGAPARRFIAGMLENFQRDRQNRGVTLYADWLPNTF